MKRSRLAPLLALLAVLLGIGNGLVMLADGARTHVVCPEHGDLVEVGSVLTTEGRPEAPELRQALPPGEHESCVLSAYTHAGAVAPLPGPGALFELPAPAPAPGAILAASPSRGPPGLLLHSAPKTSPPRA